MDDSDNPLTPLVRTIVQQLLAELRENPPDRQPDPRLLSVEGAARYLSRTPSAIRECPAIILADIQHHGGEQSIHVRWVQLRAVAHRPRMRDVWRVA